MSGGSQGGIETPKTMFGALAKKTSVPNPVQEKKQAKRYVLTVLKDGEYEPLTNEEMDRFEA